MAHHKKTKYEKKGCMVFSLLLIYQFMVKKAVSEWAQQKGAAFPFWEGWAQGSWMNPQMEADNTDSNTDSSSPAKGDWKWSEVQKETETTDFSGMWGMLSPLFSSMFDY